MKHKIIIITAFVLTVLKISSCNENPECYYSNYQDLKASGYLAKGWIPEILPECAYEIREIHNMDNNHIFGTFQYQSDSFINSIDSIEKSDRGDFERRLESINLPQRPIWFIDNTMLNDKNLHFYRHEYYLLCLNRMEKQVYFVY
jgi:hypothetical protein